MKSVLRNFNFVRVVILLSLVGSGALAYFAWEQNKELREIRTALAEGGRVEQLVRDIQSKSLLYTTYKKQVDAEGLSGQTNPTRYIRAIAGQDKIEVGQVEIVPQKRITAAADVEDETYKITPMNNDRGFQRSTIGNFLFTLEDKSRQVRVTEVRIWNHDKRVAPEAIPENLWDFECTITSRKKRVDR